MEVGSGRRSAARQTAATVGVAVVAMVASFAGLDARATYGARVSADEPQYLLSAISLSEDASLDISDEIAEERFRPFHEVDLNPQTIELDDRGRQVSPHDPLLPLLLAGPVRVGGWAAAKALLVLCAGAVAALTHRLAVTRLGAPLGPATVVVAGFAAAPPLATYGVQVYPAMPAALAVVTGVLAVTTRLDPAHPSGGRRSATESITDPAHPSDSRRSATESITDPAHPSGGGRWTVLVVAAVVALPWLAVKYVPLAAVIAAAGLWRAWSRGRRPPVGQIAVYVAAAVSYLAVHRIVYGGWTVYAAGDHFVDGEWLVVGSDPDYVGRTRRLVGLLIDRGFGIAAWNPAFIALPIALTALARSRASARFVMLAVFAAGWATATWVALTMHGWWWPGRQIVPVLPLGVAAIAALVGPSRRALAAVTLGTMLGVGSWLLIAWEASTGRRTLIVDFEQTANPWYRLWRSALPDHRRMEPLDVALTVVWTAGLAAACVVAVRRTDRAASRSVVDTAEPSDQSSMAGLDDPAGRPRTGELDDRGGDQSRDAGPGAPARRSRAGGPVDPGGDQSRDGARRSDSSGGSPGADVGVRSPEGVSEGAAPPAR